MRDRGRAEVMEQRGRDPPMIATLPAQVFISYSHADASAFGELRTALGRDPSFHVLSDADLRAGQLWAEALDDAIARADVFLLLLSPAFLASEECAREATRALSIGRALLVPVVLLECPWRALHGARQALPHGGRPMLPPGSPPERLGPACSEVATALRLRLAELLSDRPVRDLLVGRWSVESRSARFEVELRADGHFQRAGGRPGRWTCDERQTLHLAFDAPAYVAQLQIVQRGLNEFVADENGGHTSWRRLPQ